MNMSTITYNNITNKSCISSFANKDNQCLQLWNVRRDKTEPNIQILNVVLVSIYLFMFVCLFIRFESYPTSNKVSGQFTDLLMNLIYSALSTNNAL